MRHPLSGVAALLIISLASCAAPAASTPTPAAPAPPSPTASVTTPATTATAPPAASETAAAPSAPSPIVLGADLPSSSSEKGFGEAQPREVDFGNHPTTILRNVVWDSWGGENATGTGEAIWVGPGQSTAEGSWEPTVIRAWGIGTCPQAPDRQAYTMIQWDFERVEEGEQPTPFDLCTGDSVIA